MRGCLRLTRSTLHQRRDKGGNAHNFPFDTLTKVYRDAVYVPQERYRGNPMYPERGAEAPPAAAAPSPSSNVTNHVGNIGVMSPVATKLSEWMEEQQQQQQHGHTNAPAAAQKSTNTAHTHDDGHPHHHHDPQHSAEGRARATPISRGAASARAAAPPRQPQQSLPPSPGAAVDDAALRQRLRTHLFAKKQRSPSSLDGVLVADSAAAAAPRHSGVQVEILNTYRSMLREVARMQDADTRRNLTAYIRQDYEKHRDIPRKNIMKIEWQLNYGKRKLEDLQAMGKHTKFTMMR